ncbi:MAG: amino acid permease [Holosporaceae bacterium]|nr:amino acid permease [Holosporaceae bacterium]
MAKKMGFGAVLAIVFGSQIGSGIFILPSTLAPYGKFGVYGWALAGLGAILLALVFANLCSRYPLVGGPHVYVNAVFGRTPGFFIGWAYWLISWISSTVVVVSSVAYLTPVIGDMSTSMTLLVEISLLLWITAVNCRSVESAGRLESVLVFLKFIPFAVVPAMIFGHFDTANIVVADHYATVSDFKLITKVISICFWGFIGVECATTPAGFVHNPSKTIPRAVILGTCGVAAVYILNNTIIMGVIPGHILANSKAPFVDALSVAVGGNSSFWLTLLSLVASIVCIGTLNAWVLTSAQISLGLAQDKQLPKLFGKKNRFGAPYVSILISSAGTIPVLILTKYENMAEQVTSLIDISVKTFIVVYLVCCMAFLKISFRERKICKSIIGIMAAMFCGLMLCDSDLRSVLVVSSFFLSGFLMLPLARRYNDK